MPARQDGRRVIARLLIGAGLKRILASRSHFPQPAQALIARDRKHPRPELRVASEKMEVDVSLDGCFLCGVLSFRFVL